MFRMNLKIISLFIYLALADYIAIELICVLHELRIAPSCVMYMTLVCVKKVICHFELH